MERSQIKNKIKMTTQHDGDCTIYASLHNDNLDDGICTCGYGHQEIIHKCIQKNY